MLTDYLMPLIVAFAAAVALLPVVARASLRFGVMDRPDGQRKLHTKIVPRSGGVAVLAASALALGLCHFGSALPDGVVRPGFSAWGAALAVLIMAAVGLADDRFDLRGRHKLLGQIAAIAVAIAAGVRVDRIQLFGLEFDLGYAGVPLTGLWLLVAVNAFNLLDGMDGMAGCVSVPLCLTIAAMAALGGNSFVAVTAVTLAGALLGFLVFNLPPAKVYLGDCGSLSVGFIVSILAVEGSLKGATTVAFVVPVALLTLPIMDTGCAVLRRVFTGRSLFCPDRGHLHHCLLQRGLSVRVSLLVVCGLTLVLSGGAFASVAVQNEAVALVAAVGVIGVLVLGRLFGGPELRLVGLRAGGLVRRLVRARRAGGWEMAVRLQGTSDRWALWWAALAAEADRLRVDSLCLDVNAPRVHEGFHARRESESAAAPGPSPGRWDVELPVRLRGVTVGRLRLGGRSPVSAGESIAYFTAAVARFEAAHDTEEPLPAPGGRAAAVGDRPPFPRVAVPA